MISLGISRQIGIVIRVGHSRPGNRIRKCKLSERTPRTLSGELEDDTSEAEDAIANDRRITVLSPSLPLKTIIAFTADPTGLPAAVAAEAAVPAAAGPARPPRAALAAVAALQIPAAALVKSTRRGTPAAVAPAFLCG